MPHVRAFAVEDDGRIVGLIYREAVESASRYTRADQRVRDLMTQDVLILPSTIGLRKAVETVLSDPGRREAFVVMEDGQYVGVSGLRSLIDALMAIDSVPEIAPPAESHSIVQAFDSEFRGHLLGLLAMTDRLGRQNLNPDAQTQVRSIQATGETLLKLADEGQDLLKARQGRLELKPGPQLLRELVDTVQDRWTARASQSGVSLLASYDGDPDLSAMVDANRMIQVFDNLVDHALQQTREGSVEVSLHARTQGGQVKLKGRVRDTGAGLSSAGATRILNSPVGNLNLEGSLPLSLTRGIVTCMKGSIRAEDNAGQGMTVVFEITVPALEAIEQAPVRPTTGASPHVLVVDDNATNRMVAEALCAMFDCTCETASDGFEAVEAARVGRFDMILMDIKMPRMDGLAATKAIRNLSGPAASIPIVALTANVDAEDARSYLAAGMCSVVEKPIKPDRLLQAIMVALTAGAAQAGPSKTAAA
jgi:CheY-like chemotaxis protein